MMKALSKIIVGVLPAAHIFDINVDENGKTKLGGVEGRFLNSIMTALRFSYEMLVPDDYEWGQRRPNGSWSGLIGLLARDEADIAIGTLSITEERTEVVDFSTSYAIEETTFAIKKIGLPPTMAYLLYPFDMPVWIGLLGVLLCLSVTVLFLFRKRRSLGDIFLQLFSSVVRQPLHLGNEMQKFKLAFAVWFGFAFVMSTCYSASLLSFLTVPITYLPVQNFRQLTRAVQAGTHKCFALKGVSTSAFLRESEEEYLVKLGELIELNKWYYKMSDMIKGDHISDRAVQIQSVMAFDLFYGAPDFKANILVSKDHLAVWPMGMAINKKFCCKLELNRVLSRFVSSGLYMKYLRDESIKILLGMSRETYVTDESTQLSVRDVSGAFMLLCIGYSLSLIALCSEIIYFYLRVKS